VIVDFSFDPNLVYNKETGKPITEKEFNTLVRTNPNLNLEKIFSEEGHLVKYVYDPKNQNHFKRPFPFSVAPKGKPYPNFIVTTISGKKIELEELKGKLVLVRFEYYSDGFRFKENEIVDLNNKINTLGIQNDIESIIIFKGQKKDVESNLNIDMSAFHVVINGGNFFEKYQINRFPKTALIDKNGNLIDYYDYSEDIEFEKHF
jgi:hypothetical protein